MDKQREIDIKNLRFYALMADGFDWHTDVIHKSVIRQTLHEIASRLEGTPVNPLQCLDCGREDVNLCLRMGHKHL